MNPALVLAERRADVLWLTLNNPDSMNALSSRVAGELWREIERLQADPTVRCVVITGTGKAFSAGGELREFLQEISGPQPERFVDRIEQAQSLFRMIEALPMPVIAAVNGFAVAGGLELLLCCDIIVAAESARIGDGHAKFGVIPGGGSTARLPRKIGVNRAREMLLTAQLYPARTLEHWGLVNRVVPDADLHQTVAEMADTIARHSPIGIRTIKSLAARSLEHSQLAAEKAEIDAFRTYLHTEDFREGLTAFGEKRSPVFKGR